MSFVRRPSYMFLVQIAYVCLKEIQKRCHHICFSHIIIGNNLVMRDVQILIRVNSLQKAVFVQRLEPAAFHLLPRPHGPPEPCRLLMPEVICHVCLQFRSKWIIPTFSISELNSLDCCMHEITPLECYICRATPSA